MKSYKQDMVRRILNDMPHTRDNDKYLTIQSWYEEINRLDYDPETMSFMEFAKLYTLILSDAQTITRLRRLLQMREPKLRGEKYKFRMANQENVKEDLGYSVK